MYTHCPSCDTNFEISQEFLDIADGQVRCGKCDHIFNALENLYEKQIVTPDNDPIDKLNQLQDKLNSNNNELFTRPEEAQTDQFNSSFENTNSKGSLFEAVSSSIPSTDIKEKMERIAASLSAATAELKNARKATTFHKLPNKSKFINDIQTAKKDEPLIIHDPSNSENLADINTSLTINKPIDSEDLTEIDTALTDDDILDSEDLADIDTSLTINEPIDSENLTETDTALTDDEQLDNENELDLVDFNDNKLADIPSPSTTDFNPGNIDEGDIDILNSLMDEAELDSSSKELLNELDDINKTLSDNSSSLDDEFSNLGDEFDDLDSGDDLLAELEQLESDFLNNDKIATGSSGTDSSLSIADGSLSSADDSLPADGSLSADDSLSADGSLPADGSLSADGSLPADGSFPQGFEEDRTSANSGDFSTEEQHEEVVPSFLTQSDSSRASPASMLGWLTGTIVLLLLLASQYLHINSIKFSQDQSIRPFLETLCPITNCPLPLIKTPRKIVTVSHDVRSHPNINNALEIQLTFKNKANYTQGYPLIEITFSNPSGEVIARRKFFPDEYLSSDIQYANGMKSNQSQKVKLNIVDPDPGSLLSFQFNYL